MNSNQHGQEVLSLIERVHAGTAAVAASLPRAALGAGPSTTQAAQEKLEEVRQEAEAAGDPRDAPLNLMDVSRTGRELGIREDVSA